MIHFTTVTPSLPIRIQDVDDTWQTVLAIHSYFDDLISGDEEDTHSVFVTQYSNFRTCDVSAQILTENGWRDL